MTKDSTVRLLDIAKLLGVSKQRAHQMAAEPRFPTPVSQDSRGQQWDRREVERWAKSWREEKRWR
jgi:predicted DNA-binding transcriptional regulator AlpA